MLVDGVKSGQEVLETLRPDRDGKRRTDGGIHRVSATHPAPEPKGVHWVDAELLDLVQGRRDGDKVLGDGVTSSLLGVGNRTGSDQAVKQPRTHAPGIGQSLQSGEGLRGNDDQGRLRVKIGGLDSGIGRVNVGDEAALQTVLDVGLEGLIGHHGAKIGAANAHVDDSANRLAGDSLPLTRTHLIRKGVNLVEHLVNIGNGILTVNMQLVSAGTTQRGMEDGAVLGDVDVLTGIHRVTTLGDAHLRSQFEESVTNLVGKEVLR